MVLMNEMNLDEHLCSVLLEKEVIPRESSFAMTRGGDEDIKGGSETL